VTEPRKPLSRRAEQAIGDFLRIPPKEPARMQKRATRDLAELVESLRVKYRIGRLGPEDAIREAWPEVVGAANAAYSHPIRIDGRRLIVAATHSVVRNELFLNRAEIIERIGKIPSCAGVTDLHITSA
jgi:hypothetical protein